MKPILEIAQSWGIREEELKLYGPYIAKVSLKILKRLENSPPGELVIISSMTPTEQGEGKTTTTIGLAQALNRLGKKAIPTLREPSLGPFMGVKGGATGGGRAQVLPSEEINLHFTGDIHAVGSAHNLLASLIDNSIYRGNKFNLNLEKLNWTRVIDINDRSLREICLSFSGKLKEKSYKSSFEITAASEIMAILCLSENFLELKERIGKITIGSDSSGKFIRVKDLGVEGALTFLLKDALKPNLVQTSESGPALVHGGPFANIAHGCNSVLAIKMALPLADLVITETGFGVDLGAEKFIHLVASSFNLSPRLIVIVASLRALKKPGGAKADFKSGMENLEKQLENVQKLGLPPLVVLNKFVGDSTQEIAWVKDYLEEKNIALVVSEIWEQGGKGGESLAQKVLELVKEKKNFKRIYETGFSFKKKVEAVAGELYGAGGVNYSREAEEDLALIEKNGWGELPICLAKTHKSLSDNPELLGRPRNFQVKVERVKVASGAGFLVVYCGKILTLPGLPPHPRAERIDVGEDGEFIEKP